MIFGPFGNKLAITYFDDILVYAKSWEELIEKLKKILQLLRDAGLTLNIKKCKFGLEEVEYLGFTFGKDGMSPGNKKVRAISDFPAPHDVHSARSFHGLVSFFRRFIPGFAKLATPIVELFRKEEKFIWDARREEAFNLLKTLISSKPVVRYFNTKADRTELHTDASSLGLGAMLLQSDEQGEMRLIYAISRRTSEVERNYHSSKLELLAIKWAMERLRRFLIGIKFTVITDCQSLIHLDSFKTNNPLFVRWLDSISEYNFEIQHHAGDKMKHVDALSRARISEHYYFPQMRRYVRKHVAACVEYLFAKHKPGKQAGELHPIPAGRRPFEVVHIDHLGPFVTSSKGNKYILALNCNLTKFCQLYTVRDTKATTTVRKVEDFIQRFGAQSRFITDRGTSFTASKFKDLCDQHGIKLTLISSRHAQANGHIERLNQTILPALQSSLTNTEGRHWDDGIRKLERDSNTSISKTTGKTPFESLYGYVPRFGEGLARELSERSETYRLPEEIRIESSERNAMRKKDMIETV